MYILVFGFCGAGVEIRPNLPGGISPEDSEVYTLRYQHADFYGTRVKVRLYLRGGISPESQKCTFRGINTPFCGT